MVYFGQSDCYQKGPEMLAKAIGIDVSRSQIHRVTDTYGNQVESQLSSTRTLPPLSSKDVLYVEVDGSMILTRRDGWKEVKVGRVFKGSDCLDSGGSQSWIKRSQYVAYLGDSQEFKAKMEPIIESYDQLGQRLVFICDGATWIRNWIQDVFPEATSILDYYHAIEHLYEFVEAYFKDKQEGEAWASRQKELLLDSQVKQVLKNIDALAPQHKQAQKLTAYYLANQDRMDYRRYRQIGCGIIGSGAIESAHRVVIQKRMKQSGQRWSRRGAQNMLNLRVTYENDKWENIINLVKTTAQTSARKQVA